jgi:hypothetical protein
MAMEVSPAAFAALTAQAQRQTVVDFRTWWAGQPAVLGGALTESEAQRFFDRAAQLGLQLGIFDDDKARLSLLAAAERLLPNPTDHQWLRAIDVIFEDAERDVRLFALVGIARMATG